MSEPEERAAAALASLVRREAFDAEAVRELASLGEAVVPALEDAVGGDDPNARRLAVRALAQLGLRSGIATLLNVVAAEAEGDPELVALALRGATKALEPRHAERVTPLLVSLCRHADPFVRAAAVDALAGVRAPVPKVFLRLRSDEDEFVAERAKAALGNDPAELVPDAAGDAELRPSDLPLLTDLASPKSSERLRAIRAIADGADGATTVSRLLPPEEHGGIRNALLEAALYLRSAELYPVLRSIIEAPYARDGERSLAFRALVVPTDVPDSELVAMVDRFGCTRDPLERAAAADFGMRSGRADVIEAATRRLGDSDPHVRESVARAFRDLPSAPAVPRIITRLREIGSSRHAPADQREEWAILVEGLLLLRRSSGFVGSEAGEAMLVTMREGADQIRGLAADAFLRLSTPETLPGRTLAEAAEALFADARYGSAIQLLEQPHADVDYAVPALIKALYRADTGETSRIAAILRRSELPAAQGAVARLTPAATPNEPSPPAAQVPAPGPSAEPPAVTQPPGDSPNSPDKPAAEPSSKADSARPAPRPGGTRRAADGARPKARNTPENAPLLLQEPPSTFLPPDRDRPADAEEESS